MAKVGREELLRKTLRKRRGCRGPAGMGMYTPLILLILQVHNNPSVKQGDGESGGSTVEVLLLFSR